MSDLAGLIADLEAEQRQLDEIVARLSADQWDSPTSSPGWTVTDQIGHLCYFDGAAAAAIADPDTFAGLVSDLVEASRVGTDGVDDYTLGSFRALDPAGRLEAWRRNRRALAEAAAGLGERDRVSWYGPSMGAKSFVTARLMEVWAHGTDVCDAVGARRPPTDRLRHIAHLGYVTRGWSYANRGLDPPAGGVRVELTAPSGALWTWGNDGGDAVRGRAEDFCLVVTQRRHVDDTDLELSGPDAVDWMHKAQAFAGPPTDGPQPRRQPNCPSDEPQPRHTARHPGADAETPPAAKESSAPADEPPASVDKPELRR